MSFGIGLGAFVDGFEGGMETRNRFDAGQKQRKKDKAIEGINADTKSAFNEAVGAGQVQNDQYDKFWMDYALPKIKMQMIEAGDYAGAKAFDEWGRSDAALEGGRYSSSAILKAQTGDVDGAINDGLKAAQTQGYMSHSYKLIGSTPVMGEDGKRKGTTIKIQGPDGKAVEQFIKTGDEGRVIGVLTNPQNAWATQEAARKQQAEDAKKKADEADKRKTGLEDYEVKKKIDQKYPAPQKPADFEKQYGDARKARQENDLSWDDKSAEEQEELIRSDLKAGQSYAAERSGTAAPAASGAAPKQDRVLVNKKTGKVMPAEAPRPITPDNPQNQAIGLGP